ncbi:hypothetical protein G6F56_007690 [Rhizopus delemar]|nr:hypothetical protein G6F56_007690 [Rhizopus delemar]
MEDIPRTIDEHAPLIPTKSFEQKEETLEDVKPHIKPLASTFLMIIIAGLNDGALGSIIPRVKQYYDIPNETVSLLFLCSACGFFISASLNGYIVHKIGQLNTIYLSAILQGISFSILMMGFPFPVMGLSMGLTGFGSGLSDAAINVFAASLPMATLLLNIIHALYGVGAMLSPLVATFLLEHELSWKGIYMFLSALAVLNILGIKLGFKGVKLEEEEEEGTKESRREIIKASIAHPMTIIGALYILIYVGDEVVLGGWGYTYLTEGRYGDPVAMGRVISGYWAGLAFGRVLLGYLAGKFGEKFSITVFTLMMICCLTIMSISADVIVNSTALVTLGLLLGPMFPTTISLVSKVLPRSYHTTSIGFIAA